LSFAKELFSVRKELDAFDSFTKEKAKSMQNIPAYFQVKANLLYIYYFKFNTAKIQKNFE
jgi:hypothetical protein